MQQSGMTPPPTSTFQGQPQTQQFQPYSRTSQPQPSPAFFQGQQQQFPQQRQSQHPAPPQNYQSSASNISSHSASSSHHSIAQPTGVGNTTATGSAATPASAFYPSPFQKHFDQLDQEYDAQHARSMLDDPPDDADDGTADPSPVGYAPQFMPPQQRQVPTEYYPPQQHGQSMQQSQQYLPPTSHPPMDAGQFGDAEAMLDADPFGLSASMTYPTNYSFQPGGR